MRLTTNEISIIKSTILAFDSNAEIYLYGSRVDDNKLGGDIDLLVMSKLIDFNDKIAIIGKLFDDLNEQKIDLLIAKNNNEPFTKIALNSGIKL